MFVDIHSFTSFFNMHLCHTLPRRTLLSLSLPVLFSTMVSPKPSTSSSTTPPIYPSYHYRPRHSSFPYTADDFLRADETPDSDFYSSPRFVTHIDDNAIALLREYYLHSLPRTGKILDFCSSWISHFPKELEEPALKTARGKMTGEGSESLEVIGMGINKKELEANAILSSRILQDLNIDPSIPSNVAPISAATCVVSIDYLTHPVEVLSSLRQHMLPGGQVHLVISNRCFPTKAVGRWLRVGEQEKLNMVGDYLWWSGWREVEILTVCDGKGSGGGWFGMGGTDPLWVVRGTKVESVSDEGKEELAQS